MQELKTERGIYTPEDFLIWQGAGVLVITPKFQRRSVWRTGPRSFFIDTMLRGMAVPPIYLRITQNNERTKAVREVVDGQQRIRSVLEYMDDGYRLSKTLNAPWANKRYSDLSKEYKDQISNFSFSAEIFKGISDKQVLEIFSRLNIYGVPLNGQELLNGQWFGLFKQCSYELAFSYLEFWRTQKIFSEMSIARMLEVEMTSELLIAGNQGMQDKKGSISTFYEKLDEVYPDQVKDEKRFHEVMATISETFSEDSLSSTEFHRPPMFYTLYCVIYHFMYGLPKVHRPTARRKLTSDDRQKLLEGVVRLSDVIVAAKDAAYKPAPKYIKFLVHSSRQTDNIAPRETRFNTLFEASF